MRLLPIAQKVTVWRPHYWGQLLGVFLDKKKKQMLSYYLPYKEGEMQFINNNFIINHSYFSFM